MKKYFLFLLLIATGSKFGFSQDKTPAFGIKFSGYVRTDLFWDSRQSVSIREGHFYLYPENVSNDANGKDIMARSEFNILTINSRLKGIITGPDAWGAKTSGMIEGEFFGTAEADINGFRLRHAYVKLNWPRSELLIGQYWHPMFVLECFPATINFNTGSPFLPNSRNPQLRFSYNLGNLRLIAVALSQRDFDSKGPDPAAPADPTKSITSSVFMRNAGIPNLNFQVQYRPDSAKHVIGAGIDYKVIMPELYTIGTAKVKYVTDETLPSLSYYAFAKIRFKPLTAKFFFTWANNATDLTMIGGYAVKDVTDPVTGHRTWTNISTAAVWADFYTNAKKWNAGLFLGYTSNQGSADPVYNNIYFSRGSNIDHVYRVSARVVNSSGKFDTSFEMEYTVAAYGTINGVRGMVLDAKEVSNLRPLLSFCYNF